MKKILSCLAVLSFLTLRAAGPNEKMLDNFKKSFPNAQEVVWSDVGNNNCEVAFNDNKIKCKLWYDDDGNIVRTTRYYFEDNLNPFILARLREKYAGKSIYCITEVSSDEGLTYYIVLEDKTKWYHVTATSGGQLSLEKKFNKA